MQLNGNTEMSMSESLSAGAGGLAVTKAIPILGPVLATVVVMCLAQPKSKREWVAALISTVAMSLFGGSALVTYLKLNDWADDIFGLMGITGICFVCGLPAWLVVRALFAWMEKNKEKDVVELAKAVRNEMKNFKEKPEPENNTP